MRAFVHLVVPGFLALASVGCLRVSQPEHFSCDTNSDCLKSEKCLHSFFAFGTQGKCVSRDFCEVDTHCENTTSVCIDAQCTQFECVPSVEEVCGNYRCEVSTFSCLHGCSSDTECRSDFICNDGRCVEPECSWSTGIDACGPDYICLNGRCLTSCEQGFECTAGRVCDQGACVLPPQPNGQPCVQDAGCLSGSCCPTDTPTVHACAAACPEPLPIGAACTWDARCLSANCVDGECAPCADSECVRAVCGDRECGALAGTSCGSCEEGMLCNADFKCFDPCANQECGTALGIECGDCEARQLCSAGLCYPACVDMECGTDRGVDCGSCQATEYCDTTTSSCVLACQGVDCGLDHGIDCGSCGADLACDSGSCVDAICPVDKSYYCKGDEVWWCNAGLSEQQRDVCTVDEYCEEGQSSCTSYLCDADQPACSAGVFGTCSSGRKALLAGGEDCTAQGLDCTSIGCGTQTVDVVGICGNNAFTTTAAFGNVYRVDSNATLTKFGQCFDLATADTIRWFVAEAAASAGPYTTVYSATLYSDVLTGTRYSPNFELPLSAGKYYILGVEPTSGAVSYNRRYYTAGIEATSFGAKIGGALREAGLVDGWDGVTSIENYLQQVTTVTLPP
ncbi:MAG: hypothetical protein OEZ06_32385 [Myxococcales bacterium]|nr:hypothetical protein [Myxococcales bacterium]